MKLTPNASVFAQRPYLIAVIITALLTVWMISGPSAEEQENTIKAKELSDSSTEKIAQVKVETMRATKVHRTIELYGRTEPDRTARLKAELDGKITTISAKRGSNVVKGQVIAKIALNDLPAKLASSKALLKQREVEYEGALKLNKKGYQGKVQLAESFAALESVKAEIERLELHIANAVIKAPFTGILSARYVEEGDYVTAGDDIAQVADLDPLVVRAHATELQISQLSIGQPVQVSLLNGEKAQGALRYIASVGDDATNTFKIEVEIENENMLLFAGLSGELTINLAQEQAIKFSPALLALDEKGNIGVKSVKDAVVQFTPINIIKSESDGIWLTGLGEQADIIVLGQGFVRAGDKVEAIFSSASNESNALVDEAIADDVTEKKSTITAAPKRVE